MCVAVFAYRCFPGFELIFAGNRDEFHGRPAAAAGYWQDSPTVLAGRDLAAGGTWLGISTTGRFGLVTNVRDPSELGTTMHSRGLLVSEFLAGEDSPKAFAARVRAQGDLYKGYNLVLGARGSFVHLSNRDGGRQGRQAHELAPGIYGLSNAMLDTPWPKLAGAKRALQDLLDRGTSDTEALMELLADRTRPPERDLPDTGVGIEWERLLSSRFVISPEYGTRCSTVIRWKSDGTVEFAERSFDSEGSPTGDRIFSLRIAGGEGRKS